MNIESIVFTKTPNPIYNEAPIYVIMQFREQYPVYEGKFDVMTMRAILAGDISIYKKGIISTARLNQIKTISRSETQKEKEKYYQKIIQQAEMYFGDYCAEYASSSNYKDKGGIEGMCEGKFSLKKAEIIDCMYMSLETVGIGRKVNLEDRKKIVNFWYKQFMGR